jgi:hypothetical protein
MFTWLAGVLLLFPGFLLAIALDDILNRALRIGDLLEDSKRAIHIPINRAGYYPQRLQCPDCRQAHDYSFSENEIRRLVHEQRA